MKKRLGKILSSLRRFQNMALYDADPLAVLETSLTSVKYAFYQGLGCSTLRAFGSAAPSATNHSSAVGGFIGGAIFTVPYLILVLFKDNAVQEDLDSFCCIRPYVVNLGKEMMSSSISGGVGVVLLEGWSREGLLVGMSRGFVGPFVFFAVACCLLSTILGAVWLVKGFICACEKW